MERVLLIRFSALGDVAMTIPIVYACAIQNPQIHFTVLSKGFVRPLFTHMPPNVDFIGADLKEEHHGLAGLNRLFDQLKARHFDAVADLHDVLRSIYLRWRFRLAGIPTAHIDKGRKGKRQLVSPIHKKLVSQKTSFERYADVLQRLGITFTPSFTSLFGTEGGDLSLTAHITGLKEEGAHWIGIAPFAAHKGKIYPLEKMEEVIGLLDTDDKKRIFLFGAGAKEKEVLEKWEKQYKHVHSLAGKLKMDDELIVMSHLDVMLSMDSANMHLASLTGIPVLSIWGATHPYAGFMGWNQPADHAIQTNLPCRPCSIYGNKPCQRGDYACLTSIQPQTVVAQINKQLNETRDK